MSTPTIKSTDTTRSWRAMRLVICCIAAMIAFGNGLYSSEQVSRNLYAAEWRRAFDASDRAVKDEVAAEYAQYDGKLNDARQYRENAKQDKQNEADINARMAKDMAAGVYDWFWYGMLQGVGQGALAWVGAWLLILCVAFTWWFILDRIREAARAAKGQA
jgi:hypothetical protein